MIRKLRSDVDRQHAALSHALSHGEYLVEVPNTELQKFDSWRDIHVGPDAERAHEDFVSSVYATGDHLRSLYRRVSTKYPDFDFSRANRIAFAEYCEYYQKKEEAAVVSEFEVLCTFLDVEQGPNYPNLATLAVVLTCPRVDV